MRSRRSCLSVPGSSPRMLAKAPTLPADEVFMDLEDSVAPQAKGAARENVRRALAEGEWGGKTVGVRINGVSTRWCYRDVVDVVEGDLLGSGAGRGGVLDLLVVPKVEQAADVVFVDRLLTMIEETAVAQGGRRREGREPIGIEVQIESAAGLRNIHEIAHASPRLEALVFGPADMSASLGIPSTTGGLPVAGYPGDHWHWVLETILVAAREAGLDAVDGPWLRIEDLEGFRAAAVRARALGYDGKWALHPTQISVLNEVFSPAQEEFDRASAVVEAYEHAISVEGRGAVMFGNEMIDEASRKMAARLAARGRAAGLVPSKTWADFRAEWEGTRA
jgi:citrate lyase subunit beta/citryl-CoA lyase